MAGTFAFTSRSLARKLAVAALGLAVTGCVSQDQYNALKLEKDRMAEQLVAAQRDASTNKAAADSYKAQLDSLGASGNTTAALVANLQQQNANLNAQLEDITKRYQEALSRPANAPSPLPEKLNNELTAFAQQNPDLVDFDSARGIVKFKSDVTFSVGDATLTAKAAEVIDRFAKILNSAGASQYELLVAGHTDNQPVHNPATIKAGHKDNWYLSSHRAISVSNELQKNGVNPARIGVVGYADQRPIASNSSAAGQQQNRRVEVLILPNQVRNAPAVTAGSKIEGSSRKARSTAGANNKDNAGAERGPVINK
jgi:chemotaxis protein MotB